MEQNITAPKHPPVKSFTRHYIINTQRAIPPIGGHGYESIETAQEEIDSGRCNIPKKFAKAVTMDFPYTPSCFVYDECYPHMKGREIFKDLRHHNPTI